MAKIGNMIVREGLRELQRHLPPGWTLGKPRAAKAPVNALVQIKAPNRRAGSIAVEARVRLDPKGVATLAETARAAPLKGPLVLIAPYLSEATRTRLREQEVGYLDLTGNIRIVVSEPGLYIETQGAAEDPNRAERPARSLKGPKAGRLVRALIDRKQALGVRALALATGIDAGYISRVLAFLDSEALITRVGRGRLESVDWPALLRRWAQDAPLDSRGELKTYLDPRGLPALVARLAKSKERYAITGSLAAAVLAPVAPPRLATIWLRDASEGAGRLGLRPAEAGANVLLLEPWDDGVFEDTQERDGAWYAAPSQVVCDLLTSPGRGPAEAEELIAWMREHEEAWRR